MTEIIFYFSKIHLGSNNAEDGIRASRGAKHQPFDRVLKVDGV